FPAQHRRARHHRRRRGRCARLVPGTHTHRGICRRHPFGCPQRRLRHGGVEQGLCPYRPGPPGVGLCLHPGTVPPHLDRTTRPQTAHGVRPHRPHPDPAPSGRRRRRGGRTHHDRRHGLLWHHLL